MLYLLSFRLCVCVAYTVIDRYTTGFRWDTGKMCAGAPPTVALECHLQPGADPSECRVDIAAGRCCPSEHLPHNMTGKKVSSDSDFSCRHKLGNAEYRIFLVTLYAAKGVENPSCGGSKRECCIRMSST